MTQTQAILDHLKVHGQITAIDALQLHGCFRLAARIKDLRDQGHPIETQTVKLANGKQIARYRLHRLRAHGTG